MKVVESQTAMFFFITYLITYDLLLFIVVFIIQFSLAFDHNITSLMIVSIICID